MLKPIEESMDKVLGTSIDPFTGYKRNINKVLWVYFIIITALQSVAVIPYALVHWSVWLSLDRRYITWLSLVTIAFNYNLWFIPVRMAFPCHTPASIPLWFTIDVLADLVYIIDMIIFQQRLQFCKAGDIIVSTNRSILFPFFVRSFIYIYIIIWILIMFNPSNYILHFAHILLNFVSMTKLLLRRITEPP